MGKGQLRDLGEEELIQRITRAIRTDRTVLQGIGDDAAVLEGPRGRWRYLLFASDMLVEGVHFRRQMDPAWIGWKALAVNVSDIAAMGGIPRYAVVSLGLPRALSVRFVDRMYAGLRRCAERFRVNLVGGDTDRADKIVIDVAILGQVERDRVVYRSGALAGDSLLVTGRLGGSLRSARHLTFLPRLKEARAMGARVKIHAMIDLSDGLGPDLVRLCQASRVSAQIDLTSIPRQAGCSFKEALTNGEDFELLMAVAPADAARLLSWARRSLRCGLHRIGQVLPRRRGSLVQLIDARGREIPIPLEGFQHL